MLTERQSEILEKVVADYINLAQPVSSELLEKKHHFGLSPATIRIEMQKLTDQGFLFQPHTSAGRVPTDEGYRFFVDNLLEERFVAGRETLDLFEAEDLLDDGDIIKSADCLMKSLVQQSSEFVMFHFSGNDFFLKDGWEEILKKPEFEEKKFIFDFAEFLKNFEGNIKDLKIDSAIEVFIGKENPFSKEENFSVISSRLNFSDDQEGIVALLGPKRMDYNRNINLMNSLIKILEKL